MLHDEERVVWECPIDWPWAVRQWRRVVHNGQREGLAASPTRPDTMSSRDNIGG